jgi:hypothetical protein
MIMISRLATSRQKAMLQKKNWKTALNEEKSVLEQKIFGPKGRLHWRCHLQHFMVTIGMPDKKFIQFSHFF